MLNRLLTTLKKGKNKKFYQINNEQITYKECYKKVIELSKNLKKQGNSPVIIYGHKSIEQVLSILSCVVAKRCYIPIDICTPVNRIADIIKKSNSSLIIKNENINIDSIECLSISELNEKYSNIKKYYKNDNDKAYIMFTSGSTGKSKGVPISYENLNNFIKWSINTKELKKYNNLNILSQASFGFDLSIMDLYFSIYKGCTIVGIDNYTKENLSATLDVIKNKNINLLIMTPTFIKILLLDNTFNSINYKNIKCMFFCGECLEVETVKKIKNRFKDISIINAYGPTEATCFVSLIEVQENMLNDKLLPVGKIKDSAVEIELNNDEIVLKGKSVFENYLEFESNNCYKEKNNNCYKTGDIGYINEGYLYCNGRIDNQIKYMGYRIELGDIENNLLKIDGINEAVVICKNKENSNIVKLIIGYIVIDKNINEEYIKKELSNLLPHYMIPKKLVFLEKIPVNENGKYDRKKLTEL